MSERLLAAVPDVMIATRGLTRRFGPVEVLRGIDLEVPRGAVYGFIGPNGAGKTTCLRILAGLLDPTSGSATVAGVDVVRERHRLGRVLGYMPDFFGVYDDLSVKEYLDFYAAAHGIGWAEAQRLRGQLLELVGLQDRADMFVNDLSRGMKQRLGVARALVHDPEVLLLDEPASGLDPAARVEFRALLRELAAMGKTVVVSSHILAELSDVSTHVGFLVGGRLLLSGPIDDVLARVRRRAVRIRFAGTDDLPGAAQLLARLPGVSHVDRPLEVRPELVFDFDGDDRQLAAINARLVEAGFAICHLADLGGNLEDVFLNLIHGQDEVDR